MIFQQTFAKMVDTGNYDITQPLILIADFNASATEGYLPLSVIFRDSTIGVPTAWEWDFNNDGNIDSNEQNPIHTYFEPGEYTVTLSVENDLGETDTIIKENYISVSEQIEGIVAYYPFTGNAEDESGNDFHGTSVGADLTVDRFGASNSAYHFAADGGHIEIPYNLFSDGFPFSVSFWVKADSFENNYSVTFGCRSWDSYGEDVYHSLASSNIHDDRVSFHLGDGNGGGPYNRRSYVAPHSFNTNEWYHVIFIIDNLYMEEGRIIVNGEDVDFSHYSGTANSVDFSSGTFDIGAVKCNGNSYFGEAPLITGCIDDFYVFNRILNDAEIQVLYTPAIEFDFVAEPLTGRAPLEVQFTDLTPSTYLISSWNWDLDGDDIIDSYDQNPVFIYDEEGIYNVKLYVYSEDTNDSGYELKPNYIDVQQGYFYGDIDGNEVVESIDASYVLMHTVDLDPLPEDPLPWEEWREIQADVNLDSLISAYDAAIILQYVVGTIDELPIEERIESPECNLVISNDDDYIYLIVDNKVISLQLEILESQNVELGSYEMISEECISYQNDGRFSMANAYGVNDKLIKIPYLIKENENANIKFSASVNNRQQIINYEFSDHAQSIPRILSIHPNPFNPSTEISFEISDNQKVELNIYNLKGQLIKKLVNSYLQEGQYRYIWNGTDSKGQNVGSGLYFYNFTSQGHRSSGKLILLQ